MTHTNFGKALRTVTLLGAALTTANVMADPPQWAYYPGYVMGPGMMGGYGMGPGMMGGYGWGPGPMGGYGMGPVINSYAAALNLTEEQRDQIAKIQNELRQKHLELMGKIQGDISKMRELYGSENRDDDAISKLFKQVSELRQEMFDQMLSARKQLDGVLTKEQRDLLNRN